jgi:hypothetical protein
MVRNGDPVVVALRPASNKLGVAVSMKENVINPALAKVFHPFLNVMTYPVCADWVGMGKRQRV